MKALLVRVKAARLSVEEELVSSIGPGMVLFLGIANKDCTGDAEKLINKIVHLRIFEDENKKMNLSVKDKGYGILCIPNFTLYACTQKGRRPSFEEAGEKESAKATFDDFIHLLKATGVQIESGVFGAHMDIALEANGPVNIVIDSKELE